MKKLVLISTLMASLAGVSAFGQGYFDFQTLNSQVWDGFTTPAGPAVRDSLLNVAFLWAPSGDIPTVEALLNGVPNTMVVNNSTYSTTTAWTDILGDPNFTLAVNANTSAGAIVQSDSKGRVNYNGGTAFPVLSTGTHVNYALFMIAWSAAYATPLIASTSVNNYVGWSQVFAYSSYLSTDTPTSMASLAPNFSVAGTIPEPTTIALAGLGGLSLLLFRRRK